MLWEAIKLQVSRRVHEGISHGSIPGSVEAALINAAVERTEWWGSSLETLADRCVYIINECDIRNVGKLRELFPKQFPKSLRTGRLVAYMREQDSEWVVEKELANA